MNLADYLPARYRGVIYSVLMTINGVVAALEVAGYDVVDDRKQAAFIGITSVLGFALARANTTDITIVREDA